MKYYGVHKINNLVGFWLILLLMVFSVARAEHWYTLASGNWDDPLIWTLDPSGMLPNNPDNSTPATSPTAATDQVTILSGRYVTVTTNNKQNQQLNIHGTLDLGNSTGHSFGQLRGDGRLFLAADNFPAGDATHFVTKDQGEGTVVYYGTPFTLATARILFHMEVKMNGAADILTLRANYTVNGDLTITTGVLRINDNTTTGRSLTIRGTTLVKSGASFTVGTGNAVHTVTFEGDVTNNGTIDFANDAQYACAATGAVRAVFTGATDNTLTCNGTTDFYRFFLQKGTDNTYTLEVVSTNSANFRLFGPVEGNTCIDAGLEGWENLALILYSGTLKLGGNINIPILGANRGGSGEPHEFHIPHAAALWINGAEVSTHTAGGGWRGISIFGTLRISSGTFTNPANSGGITYFSNATSPGTLIIDGGTVNTTQVKQHNADGRFNYIQSGGLLHINALSDSRGSTSIFALPGPDFTFTMSGGTVRIDAVNTTATNGIHIACDPTNVNVTGGSFDIRLPTLDAAGQPEFQINSTAPFYNLTLTNSGFAGTQEIALQRELEVYNLNIGANTQFDARGFDLMIHGNLTLANNGVFQHNNNTTHFIGSQNSNIIISNNTVTSPLQFYNMVVNKDQHPNAGQHHLVQFAESIGRSTTPDEASITDLNTILTIANNLTIQRGNLRIERYTVNLNRQLSIEDGNILVTDTYPGRLTLSGSAQQTLQAVPWYESTFGHIELYNTAGALLLSDVNLERLSMPRNAVFNIADFRLTIEKGGVTGSSFGTNKMVMTDGSAGARGLKLGIAIAGAYTTNQQIALFPVGVSGRYSPFFILANNNFTATASGYVNLTPVNSSHPAASGGNIIAYYWKKQTDGFTGFNKANVKSRAYLNSSIGAPARTTQVLYQTDWINGQGTVGNTAEGIINYNAPAMYNQADYTAGSNGSFVQPRVMYSRTSGVFTTITNWSTTGHSGGAATGPFRNYDIYVIGGTTTRNDSMHMTGNNVTIAGLTIKAPLTTNGSTPTLDIGTTTGHNFNAVSGGGKFRMARNNATTPTPPNADWDGFLKNDTAIFEYYGTGSYTLPTTFGYYPTLRLSGGTGVTKTMPNANLTIFKDLQVFGNQVNLSNAANGNLYIYNDIVMRNQGTLRFRATTTSRTVTVNGSLQFPAAADACIIEVENVAGNLTHNLLLGRDINIGASMLRLWRAADRSRVNLTLSGPNNTTVPDLSGTIVLNRLIVNKSVPTTTIQFNEHFTLHGATNGNTADKALYLESGRLTLDNSALDITLSSGGQDFAIPSTSGLTVNEGIVRVSGNNTGVMLDGPMRVGNGSQWLINGGTNNYIQYGASGNAELQIDNGTLRVGSQLRRVLNAETGILRFYQNHSGSIVIIGENSAPTSGRGVFEVLNAGSHFSQAANASITIVRQQTAPTMATLLLNPDTYSLGSESGFLFGSGLTPADQVMGIQSFIELQHITINNSSGNNPTLRQWGIPLTINGNLTIQSGATYNANGLNLILNGNLNNSGTFIANGNTTFISGSNSQVITGSTTFYNLTKTSTATLALTAGLTPLIITNRFNLEAGSLTDNSNTIQARGHVLFNGTHTWGGTGDGILFNGSAEQELTGNGTFGKMTINNAAGIMVPIGNNLTVNQVLKMQNGVFNIGRNLLTLGLNTIIEEASPFSATNMIRTNISFTDYGVKKTFPAGASTFVYPIGSGGKYTPVTLAITGNANSTGSITVKAADEMHPSMVEDSETPDPEIVDADNVLQYHWVLRTSGISGFSGTANLKYVDSDVSVTAPYSINNYITARLLNDGSGQWNKYDDNDKVDKTNRLLIFDFAGVNDAGLSGDYTAGVDGSTFNGAIPDEVPLYETNSTGNWSEGNIWTPNVAGGPRGGITRINTGHTVTSLANGLSTYTTEVNGSVLLNNTFGHRFGEVSGTGRVYLEREVIPAGFYDRFFAATGGTIEFGGNTNYDILGGIGMVNNLTLSGTGERRLPNNSLLLNGNLTIGGAAELNVINTYNRQLELKGNLVLTGGKFDAGTGAVATLLFSSSITQTISGAFTGTNALNNLHLNNPNGLALSGNVDVIREANLINGIIFTGVNTLRLVLNATITPAIGTGNRHVDGILAKELTPGASFVYPVGNNGNTGTIEYIGVTGFAGTADWAASYHFAAPTSFNNFAAPINFVSRTEYWTLQGPGGGTTTLRITLDGSSDVANAVSNLSDLRFVGWNGSQWVEIGGVPVVTGSAVSGTITTSSAVNLGGYTYVTLGSVSAITLATASIVSGNVAVCQGATTNIIVSLTGTPNWSYTYTNGVTPVTRTGISTTTDTIKVTPLATTTYTLTAANDNNGPGSLVGNTSITITINALPTATLTNNSSGDQVCNGTAVVFTAGGGDYYQFFLNGSSVQNSASNQYTNATMADQDAVYVRVTGNSGCSSNSTTTTITINPIPTGTLTSDDADNSICQGTTLTFTATGGSNYRFTRNNSTIQDGPSNTWVVSTLADGNAIAVVVTGAGGCSATYPEIVITVYDLPMINLGPDINLCVDSTALLDAGAGMDQYLWSTGQTTQSISASAAETFWARITDFNGCISSDTLVIQLNPIVINRIITDVSCHGTNDGAIDITVTGGNTPIAGYQWLHGPITPDITNIPAGSYSVRVTDAAGCPLDSVFTLLQPDAVAPTLAGADTACQSDVVIYTTQIGKTNYSWSVANIDTNSAFTVIAGGAATDNTITIRWDGWERHSVNINYEEEGCTAPALHQHAVWVYKIPATGPVHHVPANP